MKLFIILLILFTLYLCNNSYAQDIDWYASQQIKETPFKPPTDSYGYEWYEKSYDDKNWSPISLPDKDWKCDDCDRFYRGYFKVTQENISSNDFYLKLQSDDGIWVYVNGYYIGHWGGDLHKSGCVNNSRCGNDSYKVEPIYISDKLITGQNVVTIHVSDHQVVEYFDLSLYLRNKR